MRGVRCGVRRSGRMPRNWWVEDCTGFWRCLLHYRMGHPNSRSRQRSRHYLGKSLRVERSRRDPCMLLPGGRLAPLDSWRRCLRCPHTLRSRGHMSVQWRCRLCRNSVQELRGTNRRPRRAVPCRLVLAGKCSPRDSCSGRLSRPCRRTPLSPPAHCFHTLSTWCSHLQDPAGQPHPGGQEDRPDPAGQPHPASREDRPDPAGQPHPAAPESPSRPRSHHVGRCR